MFQYLMTDPQVLGIVAWVSGILTIIGLVAAIVQATRAKNAAEAAKVAARSIIGQVRQREALVELTAAQSHLKSTKDHLARSSLDAARIHVDFLRIALVQARELLQGDPQSQNRTRSLIVRVATFSESLTMVAELQPDKRSLTPSLLEITKIGNILDEISAHRRYTYPSEEVTERLRSANSYLFSLKRVTTEKLRGKIAALIASWPTWKMLRFE